MVHPHVQPTSVSEKKSDNNNLIHGSQRNENDVPVPLVGDALEESDGAVDASNHSFLATSSHLHGLRLFLVEIFIVTTSIVAITGELGDFDAASWILASYFFGYVTGLRIVHPDVYHLLGRLCSGQDHATSISARYLNPKSLLDSLSIAPVRLTFTDISIILRAFQGVGGGGSCALATIAAIEIVPPEGYRTQMTYMGIAVMLALILGPIAGGGISSVTTWRWIFLLNVPIGVVGLVLAVVGIPAGFPHHHSKKLGSDKPTAVSQQRARPLDRLDLPGCLLLLMATMSIVAAFQEAGSRFSWGSAYFITLLVVSVLLWLALVAWERRVTIANAAREPVLPWRFLKSRFMVGTLLGIIPQGGPLTVTNLQIPQRFQLVGGYSSLDAGVRLIPFGVGLSAGTILSANVAKRSKVPTIYTVMVGALLQILGYALLATGGSYIDIPPGVYGYQVIAGLGCGISFQTLILNIPHVAEKRDHAVGMGAANQFRAIGSTLMVAVTTALFNGFVFPRLSELGISDPNRVIETYSHGGTVGIAEDVWNDARGILPQGYNRQMYALVACGVAQVAVALLLWEKHPATTPVEGTS
ncbi:uncharacterized protein PG986_009742 [Apiospora aurea]|uniref:Major facilitator superfamily (MFS) profile domain-containing protein n=1 Tax=Apiospora aurea TaxID=335848 RepID=A0ABR1Q8J7_9PEZI